MSIKLDLCSFSPPENAVLFVCENWAVPRLHLAHLHNAHLDMLMGNNSPKSISIKKVFNLDSEFYSL